MGVSTISSERELQFDNIRGILIFLVILGHALEYFRLENSGAAFIYIFIYLFHMPVFIFIAGYFSKNLAKARNTAVRLFLIPYLLLNLLLSVILLLMGRIDEIMILSPGWTLWFLYCMFIWRLLLPDLVKVRHILLLSFIVGIFSGLLTEFGTYMAMARTLGFLPYFLAGYFTTPERLRRLHQIPLAKTLSVMIIIAALLIAYFWVGSPIPPELLWGDRAYTLFGTPLYQTIAIDVFLYVIGFAFVFVFIALAGKKRHFFTVWGQRTLAIYLLHIYLVAPLVGIGEFFESSLLHFCWLILGSIGIVFVLSRPIVSLRLGQGMKWITRKIMKD